jgi:NADPH-dependent 2,4-dienoyl-CoA reductase/sulfur reductase-like enzyme/peroxiredoxin family protein/rhodanese-related sulfurtransferase/TusA-related sulfurtransferase
MARIVIIGGVAGGASAAARARRISEDAEIVLIERGEYISFANCGLPYHIGGEIAERDRLLVQTPKSMEARFRIDVRTKTEAVAIDRERKSVTVRNTVTGAEERIPYDKLILSPGAEPIRIPIPGSDDPRVLTLRNIADMDEIIKVIDERNPGRAVIIGGGYIGLEMAEALRSRKIGVTLVELSPQVMGPVDPEIAEPLHQHMTLHGVDLRLETSVTEFVPTGDSMQARLSTGEIVDCGLAIMAIGVKPDVKLAAEAGLEIGKRGGIAVDDHMRTSDPEIFAVGDAVEVTDFVGGFPTLIPLAGPANRQGRIAADNALGRDSTYRKTQGTGICKVFDMAVGMNGMNEKLLKRMGTKYEKVYVHPASHASYYPGASPITLKLIYDPESGKILGAQAVGTDGVDKRIDVLAVAIRAGLTVFDLEELELAYAPPFGSAKDPVNYAGFTAANAIRGDVKLFHAEDVPNLHDDQLLVDVRTEEEVAAGTIPNAINIPIDELREHLAELPKEKEIIAFCQVGLRGYLACRILSQHGFKCRNLSGGYKTYTAVTKTGKAEKPVRICDDSASGCPVTPDSGENAPVVKTVDARGLQCPGPMMRVASELKSIGMGEAISMLSTDMGFVSDIGAWCRSTGNTLIEVVPENGYFKATIKKGTLAAGAPPAADAAKNKTIVVFSNDFDRVMASFIIANGAAAMGSKVTMFFTFWGINVLRKPGGASVRKNLVEKMFGFMMPRGAEKLTLSKMNMGGMGLSMMKGIIKRKRVSTLPELIESARRAGVKFVVCTMSMDLMGIKREELIDGIEEGGVTTYLSEAESGNVNLFI